MTGRCTFCILDGDLLRYGQNGAATKGLAPQNSELAGTDFHSIDGVSPPNLKCVVPDPIREPFGVSERCENWLAAP
ncbi:MAG: hypothetical protein JWM11_4063 [Planctomycetaceae bacterium]|nr:hypothetical protein [Planctomycetaceae bacterium]